MNKLYNLTDYLTKLPGISGFESASLPDISDYIKSLGIFDEVGTTPVGSFYGIMRCGKENAPLVLCDAHLDTVGFVVTELCEGGFLRVAPIGGVAAKILPSSVVRIYGKEIISGVFGSKPPHLQEPGESEKKMEISNLCVDTGLPYEKLCKLVRVGTPVGYECKLQKLLGEKLAGASFDDRLCGAAILRALMQLEKEKLNADIAFQFSGGEETGYKGAATTAYRINPDMAIVVDVTHAYVSGAPKYREAVRAGNGADICFSPQTNREFTKKAIAVAEKEGIKYQISAAPGRTGTNSNAVQSTRNGIPTLLISIPLKNMHTMSEVADMNDAMEVSKLISAVLRSV